MPLSLAVTSSRRPPDDRRVDPHLEVVERTRGKLPGNVYVRRYRPYGDDFQRGDETRLIGRPISSGWSSLGPPRRNSNPSPMDTYRGARRK